MLSSYLAELLFYYAEATSQTAHYILKSMSKITMTPLALFKFDILFSIVVCGLGLTLVPMKSVSGRASAWLWEEHGPLKNEKQR